MADGDLYLSDSPNVDTGLVEQDGQLHRSVLTAIPEGTLQISDSPNVSTGYVTDSDGKKHKVNLVAQVEGSLELSDNPSTDTGYVTDNDGKKHRVKLTAALHGGGAAPVIEELNVTPTTSAQTITAPEGTDGYNPINVSAVTSSIDANIIAGNIKKDITILGVTGSYEGVSPSGTKNITTNGTHDVSGYANADVQVPTTAPESYRAFRVNNDGLLTNSITTPWVPLPAGTTYVGSYCFYEAYKNTPANVLSGVIDLSSLIYVPNLASFSGCFVNCTGITSVDLRNLESVTTNNGMKNCFDGCSGLVSVDLSSLSTVSGSSPMDYCFKGCTSLTTMSLPSLTQTSSLLSFCEGCTSLTSMSLPKLRLATSSMNNLCSGCTNLTSADLSSLYNINAMQYAFCGCTSLTTMSFPSLTTVTPTSALYYCFDGCTALTSLYFPSLTPSSFGSRTNQFNKMLQGANGCTVHFPSNTQAKIETMGDYPSFSGTNITVLFDLPATVTLTGADSNIYTRNPAYDTATALAWKVGAYGDSLSTNTPAYYTSGTTDPVVNDTIYSDAACATVLTTISSIA